MSEIRESHIKINSGNFNPDTGNLRLLLKANIGAKEYQESITKIKTFGIEPIVNVLVLSANFTSEEAAQSTATKLTDIYENVLPKLVHIPSICNAPKVQGKTLILSFKVPEQYASQFVIFGPLISALGDIATMNQYLELDASCYVPTKEISSEAEAKDTITKVGTLLKLALITHKDLPSKILSILTEMGVKVELHNAAFILSILKRASLELDFDDLPEFQQEALKNQIKVIALFLGATLEPLGLVDSIKAIEGHITGVLCIEPAISLNFRLFVPALPEILKAASS